MTTITFEAVADNGTIRIPEQYVRQIKSKVKVVLFPQPSDASRKSALIPFYGFDTTNYKFDREEALARKGAC
jgi:hypothetical protein